MRQDSIDVETMEKTVMNRIALAFIFVMGVYVAPGVIASDCGSECQKAAIQDYFLLLSDIYKNDSTESNINKLFSSLHGEVRYEHLEYDAYFDRGEWELAFKQNLQRGAYSEDAAAGIRVEKYIFGKSHVAVEYSYGVTTLDGGWSPKGDQQLLALFGFKDSKIVLVREYW